MMATGSSIVVPVVLWGKHGPTHCISSLLMTPDMQNIITGGNDGELCIWDVTDTWQICPRSMLFGHTAAITCLALGTEAAQLPHVVSASENGEMCLWDISDGRCIENVKMAPVHTDICAYNIRSAKTLKLVCNGYYPEVLIIDPLSFEIIYSLASKVNPDWISACCHIQPPNRDDDVILAITNSGNVKVWTITGNESRGKPIFEDESKQTRCLNAQTLTCCPMNQRTVLIVCDKYWQVYDASDFTLLCSESSRCGERWAGGHFLSLDRVVVWSKDGRGYLYKLPTNLLKGKAVLSANPESKDYHRSHHQTSVHAYYILDTFALQMQECAPAMSFFSGSQEKNTKLLLRGDSEGRVIVWQIPEVTETQMTLVRQESFDRLPALNPKLCATLQEVWTANSKYSHGILDNLCDDDLKITATIFVPAQGKLVCGRENGSIVIVPAIYCIMSQLFNISKIGPDKGQIKLLEGHRERVTCLLYPFNEYTRYESHHLLSGSEDFSVILWDINTGCMIHTFKVHGGSLLQLIVPPPNCTPRVLMSVCSVASDHSVALLSLKERKCILLASRQIFPVKTIRWRPLDDFILIHCVDGSLYVWQMETGHLDRVVQGTKAEDILNNKDEMDLKDESTPHITLAQMFRRRNFAALSILARQRLMPQDKIQASDIQPVEPPAMGFPLLLQGIRTNPRDPDAHVLFFDTESLIVQLLTEELAKLSPAELEARGIIPSQTKRDKESEEKRWTINETNDSQQKFADVIAKAMEKAENISQKIQAKMEPNATIPVVAQPLQGPPGEGFIMDRTASPPMGDIQGNAVSRPESVSFNDSVVADVAQLYMSCLYAWGIDKDHDMLCLSKQGLLKPSHPICFGLLSRQGHMSLMLPGWHKNVSKAHVRLVDDDTGTSSSKPGKLIRKPTLLVQRMGSVPFDELPYSADENDSDGDQFVKAEVATPKEDGQLSPSKSKTHSHTAEVEEMSPFVRWKISSAITTQHLLSMISVANTLMSMTKTRFSPALRTFDRSALNLGASPPTTGEGDLGGEDSTMEAAAQMHIQIKAGWSLLAAQHCVLLPEVVSAHSEFCPPQLEMLARRWQDRCLEIREAAQALLLAELRRIKASGRKQLVEQWAPHLPTFVDPSLSILAEAGKDDDEDNEDDESMLSGDSTHRGSLPFESRRKQATAIVMLGVIGAEFGSELLPTSTIAKEVVERTRKKSTGKMQEGSSSSSASRRISSTQSPESVLFPIGKALTFLLLTPPSKRLPPFTPIRRAAMDLLGRGFAIWEPFLDISSVLMNLLEQCKDAETLLPPSSYGLPLSPRADACRTARHAIGLISTTKPQAFIITMAKEVARYNAMAQNAQSQHAQMHNSVLVQGAKEILRVINMLADKMPNDVADLITEVMDITLHCMDLQTLKTRGLHEQNIARFSMVAVCIPTKRIWVGSRHGFLAVYEMKQHTKCQMIQAHKGPVVAVAVTPDGKYVASYSSGDEKLKIFQSSSSSLFGLGSQQTKCIRQFSPEIKVLKEMKLQKEKDKKDQKEPKELNLLKLVRLFWIDSRVLNLMAVGEVDIKYSI